MPLDLDQSMPWRKSVTAIDPSSATDVAMRGDLQGNILEEHGLPCTSHLFLSFGDGRQRESRAFVASVAQALTTALAGFTTGERRPARRVPATFVGCLLSAHGYAALGCTGADVSTFDDWTTPARSSIGTWDPLPGELHALIVVAASDVARRDRTRDAMTERIDATRGAVRLVDCIDDGVAEADPFASDPFDEPGSAARFAIGASDPAIDRPRVLVRDPGGRLDVSCGGWFVFRTLQRDLRVFVPEGVPVDGGTFDDLDDPALRFAQVPSIESLDRLDGATAGTVVRAFIARQGRADPFAQGPVPSAIRRRVRTTDDRAFDPSDDWRERLDDRPFDVARFAKQRGGECFFAPSVSFLKSLAD